MQVLKFAEWILSAPAWLQGLPEGMQRFFFQLYQTFIYQDRWKFFTNGLEVTFMVTIGALLIGVARGVSVIMANGGIMDTIVYALATVVQKLPPFMTAIGMQIVQNLINFLIPSGSGQAVVSMPIMTPLADLLGVSREVAVLAFQFGDGLSNILWPTAFASIICGLAHVKLDKWWKWFIPLFGLLFLTQAILNV